MNVIAHPRRPAAEAVPQLFGQVAHVSEVLATGQLRLDDGRLAQCAVSCLVRPEVADQVLALATEQGVFVLHVLSRESLGRAQISVPGAHTLAICQRRVDVNASEAVNIRSLQDIEIAASIGTLRIHAQNVLSTVSESVVRQARQVVDRAEQYLVQVSELLQWRSKHAILTAEEDIKLDAERISMG